MTPEQKKRIAHEISNWRNSRNDHSAQITGDRMAALLQDLVDAQEAEPVAWAFEIPVAGGYQTRFSEAKPTNILELNKRPLFAAPPAPSVPDGWKNAAEWLRNNYQDYPNISSLCEAMVAQSANNGSN